MKKVYKSIGKILIPTKIRKKIKKLVLFYNKNLDPDLFSGFSIFFSFLFALFSSFLLATLTKFSFWIFFVALTILILAGIYLWLILLVDKKTRMIEESLPDALQLIASNLKAGMTPDKAILLSSRPEFGPLNEEILIIGRKVAFGKSIRTALMEMTHKINSKRLLRAVEMINAGLESGGSLATLIEATANSLKEQILVDKKIKASISMYMIFIFAATSIITPILLGLSSVLVEIIQTVLVQVELPTTAVSAIPIKTSKIQISINFLITYLIIFITTTCLMGSLLLGLLGKGKQTEGIRYFIPMILLAIPIFLLARFSIKLVLGGLFEL